MGSVDGNVIQDGHAHHSLHLGTVAHGLQSPEEQGVMGDDEVAIHLNGFTHHFLGYVKTQ